MGKSEGPDGVKARFVGGEFQWANPRDDVFTAASTANTERVVDTCTAKKKQKSAILDARNAYLHVDETEKIFAEPPKVWIEWYRGYMPDGEAVEDPVWVLKKTLYGRQQASQRFNELVAKMLIDLGFEQCPMQPQWFKHFENDQEVEVHQDDFHTSAKDQVLRTRSRRSC